MYLLVYVLSVMVLGCLKCCWPRDALCEFLILMCVHYWCHFLYSGAAGSSICCIPITVSNFCWFVVMPAKCSAMLCIFGESDDSGVGVKTISMPSSSRCCSRLISVCHPLVVLAGLLRICSSVVVDLSMVSLAFLRLF